MNTMQYVSQYIHKINLLMNSLNSSTLIGTDVLLLHKDMIVTRMRHFGRFLVTPLHIKLIIIYAGENPLEKKHHFYIEQDDI